MRLAGARKRMIATDTGALILSALFLVALHSATNNQYGFHRDELATIDDARFLDWGYVVYPPVTPFIARAALTLFGPSMIGLRFFGALAAGIAMVLTGLMAREIGGKRPAQLVAAWAAAIAGPAVFLGSVFQYVSFDYLWWVLAAWIAIRLLKSENQRWWLALGAAVGLGMMTKFTMAFFLAGIAGGIVLTRPRWLLNRWLWYGAAAATLVFLPNLIWQVRHHFITLDFLKFIHARDVAQGSTNGFLPAQVWSVTSLVTVPLWIAGLYFLLLRPEGKRYRMIGWMYLIPLALFFIAKGKPYYLSPAYPMLLAAGAVWGERWWEALSPTAAHTVRGVVRTSLVISGIVVGLMVLPLAPPGSRWWKIADAANGNFNEEFGWPEMASDVGEAAAINLYGRGRGLPEVISGSNSHWLRGYGNPPPKTVVAAGFLGRDLKTVFESCELAGHVTIPFGIENIAIGDHTDIFVCRRPRQPWHVFWWRTHWFG